MMKSSSSSTYADEPQESIAPSAPAQHDVFRDEIDETALSTSLPVAEASLIQDDQIPTQAMKRPPVSIPEPVTTVTISNSSDEDSASAASASQNTMISHKLDVKNLFQTRREVKEEGGSRRRLFSFT
mmetsp:Transcript_33870/g.71224  ORF Transcript_33870/g.71224 Transcript_33870/m.71224 type:complete len:127 (-) Transcript_33870:53-433(-)